MDPQPAVLSRRTTYHQQGWTAARTMSLAQRRKIKLMILRTAEAIGILKKAERAETNAILHVTS
jgi:hypothetical protein